MANLFLTHPDPDSNYSIELLLVLDIYWIYTVCANNELLLRHLGFGEIYTVLGNQGKKNR